MKRVTADNLVRAYNSSLRRVGKGRVISAATSAGSAIPIGQKRGKRRGWQVFVKLVEWSEERQALKPKSGGLFAPI